MKKKFTLLLCIILLLSTFTPLTNVYADGTGYANCRWVWSSTFEVTFTSGPLAGQTLYGTCQYPNIPGWAGSHSYSYETWVSGNYRYHQVSIWDGSDSGGRYVSISPDWWIDGQIDASMMDNVRLWWSKRPAYHAWVEDEYGMYDLRIGVYAGLSENEAERLLRSRERNWLNENGLLNISDIKAFDRQFVLSPTRVKGQGIKISWEEELVGKISVSKTSDRSDLHTVYPLTGAKYTAYTNSACTTIAKDVNGNNAIWTINSSGNGGTLTFSPGTYYIKETTIPTSNAYSIDTKVYTVTVSAGDTKSITSTDTSVPGKGQVHKSY